MTAPDLPAVVPIIVLLVGAAFVAATHRWWRADVFVAPLIGIASALAAASAASLAGVGHDLFGGAVRRDSASVFFSVLASASTAAAIAIGLRRTAALSVALVLASCAGALVTVASGDLGVLVLGVALLVLPIAFAQTRRAVAAFAAAGLVAVGAVDLAIAAGSTSLPTLDLIATPLGLGGVALVLAGLGVIAGVVTLRTRAVRDDATYDTYVTVVLSIAGIGALLRIGAALAPFALVDWRASIAVIAAIAVVAASFVAIGQTAVRRILAHASIAQSGYAAIALTAGLASGPTAAFFLAAFALMTIGAFALVAELPSNVRLHDLRSLARRRPLFVAALGVLLLGLAGLPPTVGFLAKLYVLELAVGAQLAWLAIIAALASVLSAVAYLRILFACLGDGAGVPQRGRVNAIGLLAAIAVVLLGVVPGPLLAAVQNVRF